MLILFLAAFINLAVRVKLYLDWLKAPTGLEKAWDPCIVEFFNYMCIVERFAHVKSEDFVLVRLADTSPRKRRKLGLKSADEDENFLDVSSDRD